MHFSQIVLSIREPALSLSSPEQPRFPKDLFLRCKVSDGNLQHLVSRPDALRVPGRGITKGESAVVGLIQRSLQTFLIKVYGKVDLPPGARAPMRKAPGRTLFSYIPGKRKTNFKINIFAYAPPLAPPLGGAGAPPNASARGRSGGGGESSESRVELEAL